MSTDMWNENVLTVAQRIAKYYLQGSYVGMVLAWFKRLNGRLRTSIFENVQILDRIYSNLFQTVI
jgi:hypothetical protein